jgi:hypothetical protein
MAGINAVHHLGSPWEFGFTSVSIYLFILVAEPIRRRFGRQRESSNREESGPVS